MILNNAGSSPIGKEIQNFFNIDIDVSLVEHSHESLFNCLFLYVTIWLSSHPQLTETLIVFMLNYFFNVLLFWDKVFSEFFHSIENLLQKLKNIGINNIDVRTFIFSIHDKLGNKFIFLRSILSFIILEKRDKLFFSDKLVSIFLMFKFIKQSVQRYKFVYIDNFNNFNIKPSFFLKFKCKFFHKDISFSGLITQHINTVENL